MAADPAPFNYAGVFKVYWNGITVGHAVAEIREEGNTYSLRARIETEGLAKLISGYYSDSNTTGVILPDGSYRPVRFETFFETRKKPKRIVVHYDKEGKVSSETFEPKENRVERPAVEARHKDGVVDALTTFVAARRMVLKAKEKGQTAFTLPYYDGRRRTDLQFEIVGSETMKDTKQPVLHVRYVGIPVAGFTKNELKNQNAEDAVIDAYASDDGQLLPIAAKGSAPLGVAFGKITETCADFATCEKEAAK